METTYPDTEQDNGPTDQQIEDEIIERDIERFEEDLRGENGPAAQAKAEAQARLNAAAEKRFAAQAKKSAELITILGSPILANACAGLTDDYLVKLRSGEQFKAESGYWNENGWVTFYIESDGKARELDVRLEDIIWIVGDNQFS